MRDINLLDDDKFQHDKEEDGDSFSNTYSADSRELTSDSQLSDSGIHSNVYDRSYTRSGSKKTGFVISALVIIAIAVIAYLLFYFTKDKSSFTKAEDGASSTADQSASENLPAEVNIAGETEVQVPVFVREMINSTRQGVNTVETILTAIPKDVNLTVIQYRDGNFLAELLSKSSSDVSGIKDKLQQGSPASNVKIISQDKKSIRGGTYQQALLNGSIDGGRSGSIRNPNYLNANDVKSEFSRLCTQEGLTLSQFEIKNEVRTSSHRKTPVIFRARGSKEAAIRFLNKVVDQNINVNFSKIVFIASENMSRDDMINLILNMEVFYQI